MLRPCLLVLVLVLALALAACGGEGSDPAGAGWAESVGDPAGGAAGAMSKALDDAMAVDLDEDLLRELLAAHEGVLANASNPRAAMRAAESRSGLEWRQYLKAYGKWQLMVEAAEGGARGAARDVTAHEEQLEELRAKVASSEGQAREQLQDQIKAHQSLLELMKTQRARIESLDTDAVRGLVEEWKPRFDALEERYDG